jgi:hypothetical protein
MENFTNETIDTPTSKFEEVTFTKLDPKYMGGID